MQRQQFAVILLLSQFLGAGDRFLSLNREFIQTHETSGECVVATLRLQTQCRDTARNMNVATPIRSLLTEI